MNAVKTSELPPLAETNESYLVVANDLRTGVIVFLTALGQWSCDRARAGIFAESANTDNESELIDEKLLSLVLDVERIPLDHNQQPKHIRNKIRLSGPTTGPVAQTL